LEKIKPVIFASNWWTKAAICPDRHYDPSSGIMLTDHLLAVYAYLDQIFQFDKHIFLQKIFHLLAYLGLEKEQVYYELGVVALLHDIGKTEDDKSQYVEHPLTNHIVINRHSVVGVKAAIDILQPYEVLNNEQRQRIYWIIEQHDISYGLFREFKKYGTVPSFTTWDIINNNINAKPGAGLIYLLIFKLADIHGHANIEDVIWFYNTVNEHYFHHYNIDLPIPQEKDIR
jgi:hypothetical protein